jgi:hypothetical protein
MANPVTTEDLEVRWRPLSPDEHAVAQSALDDAWAVLTVYAGDLSAQIAAGSLSVGVVRMVECQMVLRALRNPDGAKSGTVTIDDFTRSWTLDSANSAGTLYVSDDELRLLGATTKRSGSFTMGSYTPHYTNVDPIDGYVYDGFY